jgi:hypothetical protein
LFIPSSKQISPSSLIFLPLTSMDFKIMWPMVQPLHITSLRIGVRTFPFLHWNFLGSIWPLKALNQEGEGTHTSVGTFTLAYLVHPHAILWYLCPGLHCFYMPEKSK